MLPFKSLGLLAFIVYAAFVFAAAYLTFTPSAFAASADGRPFRGYADICLVPGGCVAIQTRDVYDTRAECESAFARMLVEYRAQQRLLGNTIVWQAECRYDPNLYDA